MSGSRKTGKDFRLSHREGLERARGYLDLAGGVVVAIGADRRVEFVNSKACEVLGRAEDEVVGRDWFENFLPERLRDGAIEVFGRLMKGEVEASGHYENPVLRADGTERIICWRNTVLTDDEGRVVGTLSSGDDVTDLRGAIEELERYRAGLEEVVEDRAGELADANRRLAREVADRRSAQRELAKLGAAVEQSSSLVFITDTSGRIEYVNAMFESVTGFARREAAGMTPAEIVGQHNSYELAEGVDLVLRYDCCWRSLLKSRSRDGREWWGDAVLTPLKDDAGGTTNVLCLLEDVTEKKNSTERLEYLSNFDGTTGLTNRSHFIELLDEWIATEGAAEGRGAIFLLDIDQFKFISDTYGHGMGDEFLHRVGSLLKVTTRYVDSQFLAAQGRRSLLCRLSGDEFAVFVPGVDKVDAVVIAEQVRKGVEGFYQADVPCHLTASLGVALYPEHGTTTSELLTRADAAMYRAKDLGRNRFHFFSPEERDIEKMHSRLEWKECILSALKEDRFEAWFQPIQMLRDGEASHYEVLARMRDGEGGIVLPGPFIDIAERFGLVSSISRVIVEKAMRAQTALTRQGYPATLCVNVSGKELGDREFLYFIQSKIFETGADPERLVFEVTETASIVDLDLAIKSIRTLKSLGCRISLDDFGIGFTSFLYLREMEVDYIKIAGSFIKHLCDNLNDQLFVRAIVEVARGMDVKTIAEFVEDEKTVAKLKEFGVDFAQGFHIGEPAPMVSIPGDIRSKGA